MHGNEGGEPRPKVSPPSRVWCCKMGRLISALARRYCCLSTHSPSPAAVPQMPYLSRSARAVLYHARWLRQFADRVREILSTAPHLISFAHWHTAACWPRELHSPPAAALRHYEPPVMHCAHPPESIARAAGVE